VDDCIAIFLGSRDAYTAQAFREPGTYYLTKGWIEVSDTIFDEYMAMVERYGESLAERMMKLMLKNYTRLAYINTGHQDQARYQDYARMLADKFQLRYEEIEGADTLVKKLLLGPWDDDFVVVEPGQTITYADFQTSTRVASKSIAALPT
jgi:hypothetical protein